MRNLLPSTASMENVVCILDLLETIAPDVQRTTHRTYSIQPIVQLTCTTALLSFATDNFQRECGDVHSLLKSSVSRCIGAISKRYSLLILPPQEGRQLLPPSNFPFFLFSSLLTCCVYYFTHL